MDGGGNVPFVDSGALSTGAVDLQDIVSAGHEAREGGARIRCREIGHESGWFLWVALLCGLLNRQQGRWTWQNFSGKGGIRKALEVGRLQDGNSSQQESRNVGHRGHGSRTRKRPSGTIECLSDVEREATSQGATDVVSGKTTTETRSAHPDPTGCSEVASRVAAVTPYRQQFFANAGATTHRCYLVVLATTARPFLHACNHPKALKRF